MMVSSRLISVFLALGSVTAAASNSQCRCFPGDSCWPSSDAWDKFNKTVDGRLIATVPLATPCHAPNYDAKVCKELRGEWQEPEVQYVYTQSIATPLDSKRGQNMLTK